MRNTVRSSPPLPTPLDRALPAILSVLVLLLAGCGRPSDPGPQDLPDSSAAVPPQTASPQDAFPDKADIRHAAGFTVAYHGNYKVVRVAAEAESLKLSAEEGVAWEEATVDTLVLVQRGTNPPGATGPLEKAMFIEVPIRSAAVNRDADALRIKYLGFLDQLIGIGGTGIYDPDLRARVEAGTLPAIGSALHRTMDLELLLTTTPEAIFLRIASLEHTYEFHRLRELGLPSVPVYAWTETNGLARAEWIKYVALFFNAEAEAERQFSEIETRYEELKALRDPDAERPKVVWGYSPRSGSWRVHRRGVEAGLMLDAGLANVMALDEAAISSGRGHSEGLPISNEQFLQQAGEAELWITWSPDDETWPSARYLASFDAYRNDNVYHHRKRRLPSIGADDWYELGQLRPDWILADLIAVAYPDLLPDHELVFLERLKRTKVISE